MDFTHTLYLIVIVYSEWLIIFIIFYFLDK